jgi:hypothetical protein
LAVPPKKLTAPMHTPMISANITAYSTAVAPLSSRQNFHHVFMTLLLMPNAPAKHLLERQNAVQPAITQLPESGCAIGRHETLARKLAFGKQPTQTVDFTRRLAVYVE